MRKYIIVLLIMALLCGLLPSCWNGDDITTADPPSTVDTSQMDFSFTERDISASYGESIKTIELDGKTATGGYTVKDGALTLTEEGTYILSGVAKDICITVNAPEKKVQLVLDGLTVNNKNGCAIYVKDASKVFITLKDGTESFV